MSPVQKPLTDSALYDSHDSYHEAKNNHYHKHARGTPGLNDRLLIGGASATGFVLLCIILLWFFGVRPLLIGTSRALPKAFMASDLGAQSKYNDVIQIRKLDSSLLPMKDDGGKTRRLVIVGDVHGCRAELEALLSKIHFTPAQDHLILAGDMINKGPDSQGVISLARSLNASAVRGNHEDKLLRARAALERCSPTSKSSRMNTIETLAQGLSEDDVRWLVQCPLILSIGHISGLPFDSIVVVHAGLVPNVPLESQNPYDVMNMRSIEEKTMKASERRGDGMQWWKVWNTAQERLPKGKGSLVVYGHHSKEGLVESDYSIGLDSGCVKGGMLSALVIGGMDKRAKPTLKITSINCGEHV